MSYPMRDKLAWEAHHYLSNIEMLRWHAEFNGMGNTRRAMRNCLYYLLELEEAKDDLQEWEQKNGIYPRSPRKRCG